MGLAIVLIHAWLLWPGREMPGCPTQVRDPLQRNGSQLIGWAGNHERLGVPTPNQSPVDSHARLHCELTGFLRQHCPVRDQLSLSETVCFDRWKTRLPLAHCLAASWQRRCQRWLANSRIDVQELYGPLMLCALQYWQKPDHSLHLALDTTMLWNRFCVVVLSVVIHNRAIPLLWQTLEHPSASVSASVSIALLEKADRLLAGFESITLLADRAFPCDELIAWFCGRPRWSTVMHLRGDTEIHGKRSASRLSGTPAALTPRAVSGPPWRAALG